ncbi:MAG TPA: hypothetical protein VGE63_03310 [Candidatus Paceibacterota bacterium]
MNSGQSRGKLFLIVGGILIVIIIVVTALKSREPKTSEGNPTLFEGIKNLTRETVDTVTEYLGEQTKKIIPNSLKDFNNDSQGIPNVVKLTTTPTVGISVPEESIVSSSPDLPQFLPFPRLITEENGTIKRIAFKNAQPQETLFASGDTPELFDASFGNNLSTIIARSRTLTSLSHRVGYLTKNNTNYCPYSLVINKKNIYNQEELEQIYGLLQVNSIIPASFPPFTDYKTNVQSLIQVFQTQKSLSKKPTGLLDQTTLNLLSNTCSDIIKEEKRASGEEIPEYLLTYQLQSNTVNDMLLSPTDTKGSILLLNNDSISFGVISDVSKPATYNQIFTSPFTDFNHEFPNSETLILTARPATGYDGVSYKFNVKTGARTTLLENIPGLMTLVSPDGNYTLYSESDDHQTLYILNNSTFISIQVPFVTLPDKCAWTHDSKYIICGIPADGGLSPDEWLKGYSTNDEIKAYSIIDNILISLPQPTEEVDVFKGVVSSENKYFGFINRLTMEPWMVSLVDFVK